MAYTVEFAPLLTGSVVADSFESRLIDVNNLEFISRTADTQTHRMMNDALGNPTLLIEKFNVLPASPSRGGISQIRREFRVEAPFRVYDDEDSMSIANPQFYPATASLVLYIPRINGVGVSELRQLARSAYESTFAVVSGARSDTLLQMAIRGGFPLR